MKKEINFSLENGLLIRTIKATDIEYLRQLRNDNRSFFLYSEVISEGEQRAWFKKYKDDLTDYMFIVCCKGDYGEQGIGTVALYHINQDDGSCEFGRIMIDHNITSQKGLGTLVTRATLDIAKQKFELRKIKLEVYEDNVPAYKTYLRSGFVDTKKQYLDEKGKIVLLMEASLD